MFEWVKNVIEAQNISLISVPHCPAELTKFIKQFFDESSPSPPGIVTF